MSDDVTKRTGGRILVDQLLLQGCERVFTVPGESFLSVLDALHDTPAIELVVGRQEGGVAFMACADGALTGRPGVAFVTRGPGATNASIGVHVARQDSQPMILFIGDVDRGMRDREAFQEIDFPAMFAPIAKWAARIDDARRIPEYVARAYATAMNGRPGPVVLALPEDMLLDEVEAVDRPLLGPLVPNDVESKYMHIRYASESFGPYGFGLDQHSNTYLRDAFRVAERPIAIVGGTGWSRAAAGAFDAFARRWDVPVVAAFRRQDALPNTERVWAGNLGYGPNPALVRRVREADLLLVVGARLGEATTDGYSLIDPDHPGRVLIHAHPDPAELNAIYRADQAYAYSLIGFCMMLAELKCPEATRTRTDEAHADYLAWSTPQPREGVALDLGMVVLAMREALPADTIICNGAGNFSAWWHRYWRYHIGCQLAPTAGAMGYGVPAAVAAALRQPERVVVAVAGDGDFLMNGQELATAVQHDANILVIVVDNGAYGTIRMHQERAFPGRVSGTQLRNPDFAALARAYGCWAETVERTDEFAPALVHAMEQPGVRLLHLKTDVEEITPATTLRAMGRRE